MFSAEQKRKFGSSMYQSVDRPGENVEATELFSQPNEMNDSLYKDKINRGRVGQKLGGTLLKSSM
jgi:hypothetical protein